MSNLTLAIDDDLLQRARIRALRNGTSVNALVREYLSDYAHGSDAQTALDEVIASASARAGSSGSDERSWTRDDLHHRG